MTPAASTKPYLLRAIWEWCVDQGFTPYIAVTVDEYTQVPPEHVRDGQIVLNLSADAVNRLSIGNDEITGQARFSGIARALVVPVGRVAAIYAKENGQGVVFEVEETAEAPSAEAPAALQGDAPAPAQPEPSPGRPHLTRVK